MTQVEEAWAALESLLDEYPDVGSAMMIAAAVEWEVLGEDRARLMAQTLDLRDVERVRAALTAELERVGRRSELVALVRTGVRVRRRAKKLLKQSTRGSKRVH